VCNLLEIVGLEEEEEEEEMGLNYFMVHRSGVPRNFVWEGGGVFNKFS